MKNISQTLFLVATSIILCLSRITLDIINTQKYFLIFKILTLAIFIGSVLVIMLTLIINILKKKSPLPVLAIVVLSIISTSIVLEYLKISSEEINFNINRENYEKILQNSHPIKTKSGNEVTIAEITSKYNNVRRYLVFDKNKEFINPENKYFGLDVEHSRDKNGNVVLRDHKQVTIKKYGDDIYIVDVCLGNC